jgi:hypothetical protein
MEFILKSIVNVLVVAWWISLAVLVISFIYLVYRENQWWKHMKSNEIVPARVFAMPMFFLSMVVVIIPAVGWYPATINYIFYDVPYPVDDPLVLGAGFFAVFFGLGLLFNLYEYVIESSIPEALQTFWGKWIPKIIYIFQFLGGLIVISFIISIFLFWGYVFGLDKIFYWIVSFFN